MDVSGHRHALAAFLPKKRDPVTHWGLGMSQGRFRRLDGGIHFYCLLGTEPQ
jgi:hypothetical protein